MLKFFKAYSLNFIVLVAIITLLCLSTLILRSLAPFVYPLYFAYIATALVVFFLISKVDFDIFEIFSPHLYFFSLILLSITLLIGQVSRGSIRWIPIGPLTLQPSELVRPFLFLYVAKFLNDSNIGLKRLVKVLLLILVPLLLILIQPSLGVAFLTSVGFLGVLLASKIDKRYVLFALFFLSLLTPSMWFILKPYQKQRIVAFIRPSYDPQGMGYNAIQSMISVGSGKIWGRGLGDGIQTQLKFLPERHTDFIFAAIAEELGLIGAGIVLLCLFVVFWGLVRVIELGENNTARAFVTGVFFVLLTETLVHVGMNMGLLPITGIPLPFVSAGGSALLGTTISIALALNSKKPNSVQGN